MEEPHAMNSEPRYVQQLLQETRNQFNDLYDFAPVGYLTLEKNGLIQSINLTGSTMLERERTSLIGRPLLNFIPQVDIQRYHDYLRQAFGSAEKATMDLKITKSDGITKYFQLESTRVDGRTCRLVMTDVSKLKEASELNEKLLRENRQLLQDIFRIQEEERRFLARELHDELGQWLTAIHAEAEMIANHVDQKMVVRESSRSIQECAQEMHSKIRNMLSTLRPVLLDSLGLRDALLEMKDQCCMHHPDITFEFKLIDKHDKFDDQINMAIYRIVQEALSNICRHAQATFAKVTLSLHTQQSGKDCLHLCIEDNGQGFTVSQKMRGLGVLGMRERAIAAGGNLELYSLPNKGTRVDVSFPVSRSTNDPKKSENSGSNE